MHEKEPVVSSDQDLRGRIDQLERLIVGQSQLLAESLAKLTAIERLSDSIYHETLFHLRHIGNAASTYLGNDTAITYLSNGYRAFIDTRARDVGIHMLMGGQWETEYTGAFLNMIAPGMTVLDIGANSGWYALQAAKAVGSSGLVLAIEPNEDLASLLDASFNVNGLSSFCRVLNVAVGAAAGLVDLFVDVNMSGGAIIRPATSAFNRSTTARRKVQAVTIDTIVADQLKTAPDIVKMDIEGWEGMAFRGMAQTLASSPGLRMMVEWSPMMDDTPSSRSETATSLSSHGFRPYLLNASGGLESATWEDLVGSEGIRNIFLSRNGF